MKNRPPFDEEKAKQESKEFILRIYAEQGKVFLDILEKDIPFFKSLVEDKRMGWPHTWSYLQLEKGKKFLYDWIETLDKENKELVEDYITNIIDESWSEGVEAGRSQE